MAGGGKGKGKDGKDKGKPKGKGKGKGKGGAGAPAAPPPANAGGVRAPNVTADRWTSAQWTTLIGAITSVDVCVAVVDGAYARMGAVGVANGINVNRPAVQAQAHSATGGARQFTEVELAAKSVDELQALRRTNRRRWQDKKNRGVDQTKVDDAKAYLDLIDAELGRR